MIQRYCEAEIWPRGGRKPCGHKARFETSDEPRDEFPVALCGTHANSWSLKGRKVREIGSKASDEV